MPFQPGHKKAGGRIAGTPNKKKAEELAELEASGMMPLDYMVSVMRDPEAQQDRRDRMAVAAAPYCHARVNNDPGMNVNIAGERMNGSGNHNAEYTGIRVEFVRPPPRPDA